MRTSKPISTISYNTENFLVNKIAEWKKCGWIEYGMWIRHEPDTDGKKPHYHVYLQPAKLVQTEDLVFGSNELDPDWQPLGEDASEEEKRAHEKKMFLKMNVFYTSNPTDWILYCLHDEAYLTQKNLIRNVHYEVSDIKSTCEDSFFEMLSSAMDYRNNKLEFRIIDAVNNGQTWYQIVSSGMIPIRNMNGAFLMYRALTGQLDVDAPRQERR